MILDHKLQRMLNDSKIAQLNSERPLHQTAVNCNIVFQAVNRAKVFKFVAHSSEMPQRAVQHTAVEP